MRRTLRTEQGEQNSGVLRFLVKVECPLLQKSAAQGGWMQCRSGTEADLVIEQDLLADEFPADVQKPPFATIRRSGLLSHGRC